MRKSETQMDLNEYKFYCHDLRSEQGFFSKQQGGGLIMTWDNFGSNGQKFLQFLERK